MLLKGPCLTREKPLSEESLSVSTIQSQYQPHTEGSTQEGAEDREGGGATSQGAEDRQEGGATQEGVEG